MFLEVQTSAVITSLSTADLARYVRLQIMSLYPDRKPVRRKTMAAAMADALERLEYCFLKIAVKTYCAEGNAHFNHLHSDQYLMFLWFLSNSLWRKDAEPTLFNKVYLLNKALHSFDCSFSTELPGIFFIVHGVGIVLGKAKYADYLTVYHGCTVGQAHGKYPVIERGVGLGAGAAVLGGSRLGQCASVGAGSTLVNVNVPDHSSVYRSADGKLKIEKTKTAPISSEYFSAKYFAGFP